MDALVPAEDITVEKIEQARRELAKALRSKLDDVTERGARRTVALPAYAALTFEQVLPNTRRAMMAALQALETNDSGLFGEVLFAISYERARQGLPVHALFDVIVITEQLLREIAARCLHGLEDVIAGFEVSRTVCDGARNVILDGFQKANHEARQEIDHLARQLSAPVLPVLPGVLILPIIGAVSPSRADRIVTALLGGITGHRAHTAILDITGITDVDATLVDHLVRTTRAAGLLGARVMLVGVSPEAARTLVEGSANLSGVSVHATLAAALAIVVRRGLPSHS